MTKKKPDSDNISFLRKSFRDLVDSKECTLAEKHAIEYYNLLLDKEDFDKLEVLFSEIISYCHQKQGLQRYRHAYLYYRSLLLK